MKTSLIKHSLFSLVLLFLLTIPNNANAWSLFGSEKKDSLERADQTYGMALIAAEEGRATDAISLLSDAHGQYSSLHNAYPNYEMEHVTQRINVCNQQMRIFRDKIVSGEINFPTPEQIATEQDVASQNKPIVLNKENDNSQPYVVKKSNKTAEENIEKANTPAKNKVTPAPIDNNSNTDSKTAERIKLINGMLDSKKTTEAILFIDEIVEKEGDNTPLSIRCLYVQALISVGNKPMAEAQLNILKKQAPTNPSVRSLIAAFAIAKGDAMEAMLQLDKLIEENPTYAEARVNYAYLLLMMDSTTYRNAAIDCYKRALKLGARRDPNLEKNLNIVIK